jgi:hypothetical protein
MGMVTSSKLVKLQSGGKAMIDLRNHIVDRGDLVSAASPRLSNLHHHNNLETQSFCSFFVMALYWFRLY